ncbi:MAG: hypothetical protein EBU23_05845, partial [Mycobacteriaceae bacterium]|nr:hypothetical protein [Mycobacteriaceae bacterium]
MVCGGATTVVVEGGGTLVDTLVDTLVVMLVVMLVDVAGGPASVSTAVFSPPSRPAPTSNPAAAHPTSITT